MLHVLKKFQSYNSPILTLYSDEGPFSKLEFQSYNSPILTGCKNGKFQKN